MRILRRILQWLSEPIDTNRWFEDRLVNQISSMSDEWRQTIEYERGKYE